MTHRPGASKALQAYGQKGTRGGLISSRKWPGARLTRRNTGLSGDCAAYDVTMASVAENMRIGKADAAPDSRRIFQIFFHAWSGSGWNSWFCLSLLFVVSVTTAFIGAAPTLVFGHDDFFLLDNSWQVLSGHRPQIDFYSPWGPAIFLIVGAGMKLANASPDGIGYGNAIFGLLLGLWAYRIGRDRLAAAPRMLFAFYTTLLVSAPYALGSWPTLSSHAMLYNRYGYALLGLVVVECSERVGGLKASREEWLGALSTGLAVAVTLFLKASYFVISVPLVAASLVFWRPNFRRTAGLAAGFGTAVFGFIAYMKFQAPAIILSLRMAAAARSTPLSLQTPIWIIEANIFPLFVVLTLVVSFSLLGGETGTWREEIQIPALAIVVYLAEIGILMTNAQVDAMPLLGVFALLIASRATVYRNNSTPAAAENDLPHHASLLLLCGLLFLPQFTSDIVGLGTAAMRKAHPSLEKSPVRFTESRLAPLILYNDDRAKQKSANGSIYTTYVNDGAALLRKYCTSRDKVLTMDMQNPFPYALGWPPPRGGVASISFNITLSAQARPSFDDYFGDATVVMKPKRPAQTPEYIDGFYALFLPAMLERYQLAAESDWWLMYKKKP